MAFGGGAQGAGPQIITQVINIVGGGGNPADGNGNAGVQANVINLGNIFGGGGGVNNLANLFGGFQDQFDQNILN